MFRSPTNIFTHLKTSRKQCKKSLIFSFSLFQQHSNSHKAAQLPYFSSQSLEEVKIQVLWNVRNYRYIFKKPAKLNHLEVHHQCVIDEKTLPFKRFQSNKNKREDNSDNRLKMKDLWLFLTILKPIMWKTSCKYLVEICV